jgi:hypothetical protein
METTLNGTYSQKMYNQISADAETYTKVFRSGKNNIIYRQFMKLEEVKSFAKISGKSLAEKIRTFLFSVYRGKYKETQSLRNEFKLLYEMKPRPYYQLWFIWLQFYRDAVVPLESLKMDAYLLPQLFTSRKINPSSIKMIVTGSSHTELYLEFFQSTFDKIQFEKEQPIRFDEESEKIVGCSFLEYQKR